MIRVVARITAVLLSSLIAVSLASCAGGTSADLSETSANFDAADVAPFLRRVAALVDSGFTVNDADSLAKQITKQALESERSYSFNVIIRDERATLRVVAVMDDVDSPDLAFFSSPTVRAHIDTALARYFRDVGK
jgi:hypothetical protein